MQITRRTSIIAASVVLACSLGVLGCGKGGSGPKVANVKAGEMPVGSDWSGVYYDQFFGNLHLVREGDTVSGAWRTEAGDTWGELAGTADGNLFKYEYTEHKIGMVGPSANVSGKGFFVYKSAKVEKDPDFIEGERGTGQNEVGQKWRAIKQVNKSPNPASVKPDEVESQGTGDSGWDEENAQKPAEEESGGGEESESSGDSGE